jgi:HlyD family secretion protein
VQVGAQVSGRISKRYVDFNSKVKKGDLLAELDPTIYQANVSRDRAGVSTALSQIEGAKAQVELAKANFDRAVLLHGQGLLGEADLTTAKGNYASAVAQLHGAEAGLTTASAALKNSQTSLTYTKIYAPIDGVVVARSIDEGQTVAASFQAPVLFTIAQDLSHMNVLADIDEADLGRLSAAKQPEVDVSVSAFSGEIFKGKLIDVRFNSTTTQGVVTYPAVIEVDNPDIKLRPGMTATVSIRTAQVKAVTRVPNAALRFKPIPPLGADGKPRPVQPEPPLPKGKGRVYLAPARADDDATPTIVDIGISDGLFTVVESGLSPGSKVVVDESDPDADKKKQKSPF